VVARARHDALAVKHVLRLRKKLVRRRFEIAHDELVGERILRQFRRHGHGALLCAVDTSQHLVDQPDVERFVCGEGSLAQIDVERSPCPNSLPERRRKHRERTDTARQIPLHKARLFIGNTVMAQHREGSAAANDNSMHGAHDGNLKLAQLHDGLDVHFGSAHHFKKRQVAVKLLRFKRVCSDAKARPGTLKDDCPHA